MDAAADVQTSNAQKEIVPAVGVAFLVPGQVQGVLVTVNLAQAMVCTAELIAADEAGPGAVAVLAGVVELGFPALSQWSPRHCVMGQTLCGLHKDGGDKNAGSEDRADF